MSHTTPAQLMGLSERFFLQTFLLIVGLEKKPQKTSIAIMNALLACARYGNRRDV